MRTAKSIARAVLLAAAVAIIVAATPKTAAGDAKDGAVGTKLIKVEELRRARLVAAKKNKFDFHKPGLELTFEIQLPDGKKLIDVDQPTEVRAKDSTGRDLSDIEDNFMGSKQYVSFMRSSGEPVKEVTVRLAKPDRRATRFSLSTTFDVWGYDRIETKRLALTDSPQSLDADLFDGTKVTAKLKSSGKQTQVDFTPGTIQPFIEDIKIKDGTNAVDNMGAMWNNAKLTYSFDTKPGTHVQLEMSIRTGMDKMPCRISLQDQPLP